MKTSLDKHFKTDSDLEKNGVWFDISEDIGFLIRPFKGTNPRVKAAMAAHYKPLARQIELGTIDPDKEREIQVKLFTEICLVDWKGVEMDGQSVECNKENAMALFKELPDLFDTLWKHSGDFKNYKEDVGNS